MSRANGEGYLLRGAFKETWSCDLKDEQMLTR